MSEALAARLPSAAPTLVLASGSVIRAELLRRAGLDPIVAPASIDEDEVKTSLKAAQATPEAAAETLADLKAKRVSPRHPEALVLGCDQLLECKGHWFDKPADRAAARAQLLALSGREHRLISAAVIIRGGERVWQGVDVARLTMRTLSSAFIDGYLDRAGPAVLGSVGVYQLEGLGVQLFDRIEGDYFTILGLPLLPLLAYLRRHGLVAE